METTNLTNDVINNLTEQGSDPRSPDGRRYRSQPLVTSIYTADPSAHVFEGRIYIYTSHDVEAPPLPDIEPFKGDEGNGFAMYDYHVLSMDRIGGDVTVHPVALDLKDVPWAARQMWAPDCAYKNGTYYLYFPAKDKKGAFRIGVATSSNPAGPFKAQPEPIKGSYSIDPAVFTDDNGQSYLYFGGCSGGQLERFSEDGTYHRDQKNTGSTIIMPRVARLSEDMLNLAETPRQAIIVDAVGKPIQKGDDDRIFFEACWMHKYKCKYYLSYSTGGTHLIAYAIGDTPYGPFVHTGNILLPVQGWTTHHSVMEFHDNWWLFYADCQLSNSSILRNVKMTEMQYNPDGTIQTIDPFLKD